MPTTSFRAISVRYYWSRFCLTSCGGAGRRAGVGGRSFCIGYRAPLATITYGTRASPAKKDPSIPEPTPKPATMSNKEFRRHLKQLVARQRNEEPSIMERSRRNPNPRSQAPSPKRSRPRRNPRKFKLRRKAKLLVAIRPCYRVRRRTGQNFRREQDPPAVDQQGRFNPGWFSSHGDEIGLIRPRCGTVPWHLNGFFDLVWRPLHTSTNGVVRFWLSMTKPSSGTPCTSS